MARESAPLQNAARSGQLAKAIALNKHITACKSPADILSLYQGREFSYVNLATAINRFGRNGGRANDPRLRALLDQAASSIHGHHEHWGAQELANTCWGVAKMRAPAPRLLMRSRSRRRRRSAGSTRRG